MQPILLIGGTGLLGPAAVREIEITGQEVVCLNRSGKHPEGGHAEKVDRNSYDELRAIFRKYESFDLIDMIPYTALAAATLVEALEGKQPMLTAVSSIDVYQAYNNLHPQGRVVSELQPVPLSEESALRTQLSFQGKEYDKLNTEHIYWSYFESCYILRMPAIYGLPDISRVERYFKALTDNKDILMNSALARWRFSRSLNLNCAYAIALCAGLSGREVFNVAEEIHHTEKDWCLLLADLLSVEARLRIIESAPTPYNMNTEQHWIVDTSKIRTMLEYSEKYNVELGLKEVLAKLNSPNGNV